MPAIAFVFSVDQERDCHFIAYSETVAMHLLALLAKAGVGAAGTPTGWQKKTTAFTFYAPVMRPSSLLEGLAGMLTEQTVRPRCKHSECCREVLGHHQHGQRHLEMVRGGGDG